MSNKQSLALDGITSFRSKDPVNSKTAYDQPNMVFDYSKQQAVFPNHRPDSIVEATHVNSNPTAEYRTMNANGKPFALAGINVGGPDNQGDIWNTKGSK